MTTTIRLQREAFDVAAEAALLTRERTDIGAVVTFTGLCRADENGEPIAALTLEHYPDMAEAEIARHVEEARARWPLMGVTVIHRYGRIAPGEVPALHRVAAEWYAEHGYPVEAVRHAQGARDWGLAARLLLDHWLDLYLSGRGATLVELLARFPRRAIAASPELTAVRVAGDLIGGSLQAAGRHLAAATGALASVPADRRGRLQVLLSVLRLFLALRLNDFPVVV